MVSRHISALLALFSLYLAGCALGQSDLTMSPAKIEFRLVSGGPVPFGQKIAVTGQGGVTLDWKASVEEASKEWLVVSPATGSTPGEVLVSLQGSWASARPPGEYSGTVSFTQGSSQPVAVPVLIVVVPKSPAPLFTYLSGPNGCTEVDGFPDAATCIVPNEKPPGNFLPPKTGETYTDSNFGATVRLLTDTGCLHQYSTPSAVSATNKYVLTNCGIRELATGKSVYSDTPSDWNTGTFWDAHDDDVLYYLSGAKVMKRSLRANKVTTLVDYAQERGLTAIQKGGTGDTSKDNWVPFWAPNEKQICALDLTRVKTYCSDFASMPGPPYKRIDFTLIAKGVDRQSGKRYVILVDTFAFAVFSVNMMAEKLDFEFRGPEDAERGVNHDGICDPGELCFSSFHMDTFEDSAGIQYLVFNKETLAPCEYALKTAQLNRGLDMRIQSELGGGLKTVMTVFKCGVGSWTDDHIGCAKKAPYCAISTSYTPGRDPADMTPIVRGPHLSEIFIMRDNGAEIRRLMQHRSILYKTEEGGGYWSYPRASISNDGAYVVANSNYGTANGHRVFAVATGYGKVKALASGLVNAASYRPKVAPGSIATLFGESLANCTAQPGSFPLPGTLCGSSILFDGEPGLFYYVSPEQLNFLVPSSLQTNRDVTVSVSREGAPEQATLVMPADVMGDVAPAAFQYVLSDMSPRAVIQNPDLTLNGPPGPGMRPLRPGEWGVLYANALGGTNPPVPDGEPAPSDPPASATRAVEVYVNDVLQKVLFAGLTPYFSGLFQVNFELKPETPVLGPDSNYLWLKVTDVESPRLLISLSQ